MITSISIRVGVAALIVGTLAAAASAREAGGEEFSSVDGRFAVSFPGTPTENKKKANESQGEETNILFQATRGDVYYNAGFIAYTKELADKLDSLDLADLMRVHRESTVKNTTGEVVKQQDVMLAAGNRPGYELLIQVSPSFVIRQRVFYANGRLYQLMVSGASAAAVNDATANSFLDSFRLTE